MKKLSRLNKIPHLTPTRLFFASCAALGFSSSALAVCTATSTVACLADQPIQSATIVKPNVMFILDNSGSMDSSYMPETSSNTSSVCYKNSKYNGVYYDPTFDYTANIPKTAMNVQMNSQSFSDARLDPFSTTTTSTFNLGSAFCADNGTSSSCDSGTAAAAYYYKYTGALTESPCACLNRKNLAANAGLPSVTCPAVTTNSPITATTGTGYSKVTVNTTSCVIGGEVSSCPSSESCTVSGGITVCDEKVNFANWYSYFRTRRLMMRSGMATAFAGIDDKFRIGFYTINSPSNSTFTSGAAQIIDDFSGGGAGTNKGNWYAKLFKVGGTGSTPLQTALNAIGKYYSGTAPSGLSGDPVQYTCQKNFTILSTDGYWNQATPTMSNMDKTVPTTMPIKEGSSAYDIDDTGLTPGANFPPPYKEGSTAISNSLADFAMYYWVKDLRPSMANNVPTTTSDPAYWQHMTTFTIGLGANGALTAPTSTSTGDWPALQAGTKQWPLPVSDKATTIDDLWHAAVNGHGQYYRATDPATLSSSLKSALKAITDTPLYHSPSSSTRDFKAPNQSDFTTYVPTYRLINWSGDVQKYAVDPTTGLKTGAALWSAADQLDSKVNPGLTSTVNPTAYATERKIVTRTEAGDAVAFTYSTLSSAQKTALCYKVSPTGACVAGNTTLVDYLRGDATWEGDYGIATSAGMSRFRNRRDTTETASYKRSLIGTLVNAGPVYVAVDPHNYQSAGFQTLKNTSRSPTVYAPANDGMVHALDAATGNELWAYVPSFVIPTGTDENGKEKGLRALSYQDSGDPAYSPHYYVDATPEVSAVCTDSSCATWANILVGGLGKGGKGYYALDVTTPATTLDGAKSSVKWEFPDTANVNKMGYSFGRPLIVNTARWGWVVILPSGYNNSDGLGHIFVLSAYTGAWLKTMDTTVPNLVHISALGNVNNGMVNEAYGGDLSGNIWRFDFGTLTVKQLFSSSASTPISSEMTIAIDGNTDTRWVFFGTGQYLDVPDRSTTGTQYLVALNDGTSGSTRTTAGAVTLASLTSTNPSSGLASCPALGWKYALPTSGERVVAKPDADLRTVVFTSLIPTTDACSPGTSSYTYGMDYCTGGSRLKINGSIVPSIYSPTGAGGVTFQGTGNSTNSSGKPQLVIHTIDGKTSRVDLDTSKIYSGTRHVGWRELLNEY